MFYLEILPHPPAQLFRPTTKERGGGKEPGPPSLFELPHLHLPFCRASMSESAVVGEAKCSLDQRLRQLQEHRGEA